VRPPHSPNRHLCTTVSLHKGELLNRSPDGPCRRSSAASGNCCL
jgi:hypothetical protein